VDDQFAENTPFQHADEGLGRIIESINYILAVAHPSFGDPGADLAQKSRVELTGDSKLMKPRNVRLLDKIVRIVAGS
jgi:hypothetical protein